MKRTLLKIYIDKIYIFSTSIYNKNVEEFLKAALKKNIIIKNKKIISVFDLKNTNNKCWILLDSDYKLVGLEQKVKDVLILCYISLDQLLCEIETDKKEILTILNYYCLYYKSNGKSNSILENALKRELIKIREKLKKDKQDEPSISLKVLDGNKNVDKTIKQVAEAKDVKIQIKRKKFKLNIVNNIKKIIKEVRQRENKMLNDSEKKRISLYQKTEQNDNNKMIKKREKRKSNKSDRKITVHFINLQKIINEKMVIERKPKKKTPRILQEAKPIITTVLPKKKNFDNDFSKNGVVIQKTSNKRIKEEKKSIVKIIKTIEKRELTPKTSISKIKTSHKDTQLNVQKLEINITERRATSSKTMSSQIKKAAADKQVVKASSINFFDSTGGTILHRTSQQLENSKSPSNKLYYIVQLKKNHQKVTIVQKNTESSIKTQENNLYQTKITRISADKKKVHVNDSNKEMNIKRIAHDSQVNKTTNNTDVEVSDETNKKEKTKEKKNQRIIYAVISPTGEVLYNQRITNLEPMTVEELLMQSGLDINVTNGFINGICGISNEGMSGWVFEVNNAPVMVPANQYIVNPSDQITWKYIDFSVMMEPEATNTQVKKTISKKFNN